MKERLYGGWHFKSVNDKICQKKTRTGMYVRDVMHCSNNKSPGVQFYN